MKNIVDCDASTITDVQNTRLFSKVILNNIKSKINSEKIREAAISHSKKYTLDKMCLEYYRLYKKCNNVI